MLCCVQDEDALDPMVDFSDGNVTLTDEGEILYGTSTKIE
jgi:hypothetical protein